MYQIYMEDEQFNFQVNRFMEPYYDNPAIQALIFATVKDIHNREDWYEAWNKRAVEQEQTAQKTRNNKDYGLVSAYYQLADFFLGETDHRKSSTYKGYTENFYKSIDTSALIFEKVPYQQGYMPVVRMNHPNASRTLIFHGGFDSYLEEIIRLTIEQRLYSRLPDYNFILFEGSGQGECLRSGLPLTAEWEKPIGALLDYYQLAEADIMGMSLGGYLAVRAAAMDKRIARVVAFDSMLSLRDALIMKLPGVGEIIDKIDDPNVAEALNHSLIEKAKNNIDLAFKMHKGMDITQTNQPIGFVRQAMDYTLEGILDRVTQDVLLIGCTQDLYVPAEVTLKEAAQLVNARSLTVKILTEKSGGSRHCQVGDKPIAAQAVVEFLSSDNLMTQR